MDKRLDADAPVGLPALRRSGFQLWCAPLRPKSWASPSAPLPSAWSEDAIDLKYAKQVADYLARRSHRGHHRQGHRPGCAGKRHCHCWAPATSPPSARQRGHVSRLQGHPRAHRHPRAADRRDLRRAVRLQVHRLRTQRRGVPGRERRSASASCTCTTCCAPTAASASTAWKPACPSAIWISSSTSWPSTREKKLNTYGKGKYLLRKAFEGDWLPDEHPLAREGRLLRRGGPLDGGRSEGVCRDDLHRPRSLTRSAASTPMRRPFTKESLLYREIFEKYYPGQAEMIVDFWMPNKAWPHCDVNDPSARVLANYGASGQ